MDVRRHAVWAYFHLEQLLYAGAQDERVSALMQQLTIIIEEGGGSMSDELEQVRRDWKMAQTIGIIGES